MALPASPWAPVVYGKKPVKKVYRKTVTPAPKSPSIQTSINVLPDFMPPGRLSIERIVANGIDVTADKRPANPDDFQIHLDGLDGERTDGTISLVVQFSAIAPTGA